MSSNYLHHEMFALGEDSTPYRLLTRDHVRTRRLDGREILEVDTGALTLLADQAMRDCQHLLRPGNLAQLRKIIDDPEASDNDRFVAAELLTPASPRPASCRCARTPAPPSSWAGRARTS